MSEPHYPTLTWASLHRILAWGPFLWIVRRRKPRYKAVSYTRYHNGMRVGRFTESEQITHGRD